MGRYRIKAVSRLTGVSPELLRRWETRYHLFKPQRSDNRYREFDDEDIQLLQYVCTQLEQGRSIGELASEGREAILRQMLLAATADATPPQSDSQPLIEELLNYVRDFNRRQLEARLAECTVALTFPTLLHTILRPLMHRLGQLWAAGELSMASEHLATEVCKQRLLSMLQMTAPDAQAPLLLCACPQGEWHELGLLTYAYSMQCQGWQICYLGPNLPVREVRYGCQHLQPRRVALSLTYVDEASQCLSLVQEIEELIASMYPTFIGGQAVERSLHLLPPGQVHLPSRDLAQAALHD